MKKQNKYLLSELDSDKGDQALFYLDKTFNIGLEGDSSFDDRFGKLVSYIAYLIDKDFSRLLNILYRIDVSEQKIKDTLAENNGKNPAEIIAILIVEREFQKMKFREMFSRRK